MLVIKSNSINDVFLGSLREDINYSNVEKLGLYLEFIGDKVVTISFRNKQSFFLSNENNKFKNIKEFLIKFNAIYDGDTYIIPNLNICVFYNEDHENSYELTLYDNSLKKDYEKNIIKVSKNQKNNMTGKSFNLTPYNSINNLKFGLNKDEVISILDKPNNQYLGVNNKVIFDYNSYNLRFDNNKLTQISIDYNGISNTEQKDILYNEEIKLNSKEGIENLKNNYKYIDRTGYYVFSDLGLAVDNEKRTPNQFFFFDKSLLKFWENKFRPITSW